MVRETQSVRRYQILLVESETQARERLRQALESAFLVTCADTLAEAERLLQQQSPDALICEAVLSAASGLDLCRFVRANKRLHHLPIMILTSLTTLHDKVAGFDAGADDYVVKPVEPRHLIARVKLLVRIKRIEQNDNA